MNQDIREQAIRYHAEHKGKVEIASKVKFDNQDDLGMVYTPGMGYVCQEIVKDPEKVWEYTMKANTVAVVSDGSAVLGYGSIGPLPAIPVMEGKALVFKKFANVDASVLCLDTTDPEEIIFICKQIAPTFGGIHLEDIKAPECFHIENRLKELLDIPVFHDDQHGTAIVALAALINAMKVTGKEWDKVKVVINGAGAAGIAIAKILLTKGVKNMIVVDSKGAIYPGREDMNPYKDELAEQTNPAREVGQLAYVIEGADVFIGVSKAGVLSEAMVRSMAPDPIVFALANPIPEIEPEVALRAGAKVVATGRPDHPNQVNNVLAFPGVFRGALDIRARDITPQMNLAAAEALAALVTEPTTEKIIPLAFDPGVAEAVAEAVKKAYKG
jgi:malate dehydrogenase (oxaloacetate-decarboxylating)